MRISWRAAARPLVVAGGALLLAACAHTPTPGSVSPGGGPPKVDYIAKADPVANRADVHDIHMAERGGRPATVRAHGTGTHARR